MHDHSSIQRTIPLWGVLVVSGLFTSAATAAEKASSAPAVPAAPVAGNAVAAGSIGDSLEACLARIPKDATAGQRMIAEQSCRRDEADRKPFEMTGGR